MLKKHTITNKKQVWIGITMVVIGAASYGLLATMVGLSYQEEYSTTEVVISQYETGLIVLSIISVLTYTKRKTKKVKVKPRQVLTLLVGGVALGLVGFFYYSAVHYIPVSIAVVLLMQSIWMSVLLEAILDRKYPTISQIIAIAVVLVGTLLATDAIHNLDQLDLRGIVFGALAGLMYALMLLVANRCANEMPSSYKSVLMLVGGTLVVIGVGIFDMPDVFDLSVFWRWGIWLALLGTILPPILLNVGLPLTGIPLGAVLLAIEIPISVLSAHVLLNEAVSLIQWTGIMLILLAVVFFNYRLLFQANTALRH